MRTFRSGQVGTEDSRFRHTAAMIGTTGASLEFDLYFCGEDDYVQQIAAASNPARASLLQPTRPVGRVAGSLGVSAPSCK